MVHSLTAVMVESALDGTSLRHMALASNIANAHAENYRPMQVEFESQVEALRSSGMTGSHQGLTPQITYGANTTGGSNAVDINMVLLNQNTLHYQSLIKGMNHYLGMMSAVLREGRG
jgi:flagellar basal-body rod protein FlgB